jgi:ABC-type multidrug transport system fused ATPase/permease subunit
MWRHSKGHRRGVVVYLILSILAIGVQLLTPLVMAQLMNNLQLLSGQALAAETKHLLLQYVALGFLFWFLHGPSRVMEVGIAFKVKHAFQDWMMKRVTSMPMSWHKEHHSGSIIDGIARAVYAMGEFCEGGFELLQMATRFLGCIALLTWFSPGIGLGMLGVALLVALVIMMFDRYLVPKYEKLNLAYTKVAAAIQDYLTNIGTVSSLRLEDRVANEISSRTMANYGLYRGNNAVNEMKWFATSRLIDVAQALFLLYLILSVPKGAEIGKVYAVSEYLKLLGEVFLTFTWKYGRVVSQSIRVRGVQYVEEDYDRLIGQTATADLPSDWNELEIRGLRFAFDSPDGSDAPPPPEIGARLAVDIEGLKLRRGVRYAVVGESGGGKSTFLSLLRGLNQPDEQPLVSCDGVALPYGLHHINHHTTLIPQHPEIFSDTVRFNVTVGIPCPDERVLEALRLARLEKVLERLPNGLETNIAEKGVNLSGGERQRLALARGIFFEAEIHSELVLLDEPTSSVDAANEHQIYRNLLEQFSDRCVLSALHKFHLLPLFDEVLVFEDGRLTHAGPVDEYTPASPSDG